jgi:hypothetical protein
MSSQSIFFRLPGLLLHSIPAHELEFQESQILERETEIREIESGIHELNEIFRDLGSLVVEQGGMIGTCSFPICSVYRSFVRFLYLQSSSSFRFFWRLLTDAPLFFRLYFDQTTSNPTSLRSRPTPPRLPRSSRRPMTTRGRLGEGCSG